MKLAVALGLKDLGKLKSLPESSFLLSREDVKAAIKEFEASGALSDAPKVKNRTVLDGVRANSGLWRFGSIGRHRNDP